MSADPWAAARTRARKRLAELTSEDKIAIARHDFTAVAPAAGVIAFDYADGPNGIRGHHGATAFPSMLALAATFDTDLATRYGMALAQETLAAGRNAVFAPGLDITRVPWGGRAGQQLGEDPCLAGEIGGSIGQAVQSQGVLAIATHWVGNNFEWLRTGTGPITERTPAIDVCLSERALHEIYAEPFRRALGRYGVAGLMGSYNRLNGDYVCHSEALLSLPRRHWGWAGVTVPDAVFAVRDPHAALLAGLDLPALGGDGGRTEDLVRQYDPTLLDELVLHVLTAAEHVNLRPAPPATPTPPPASTELARRITADGTVLLHNRGDLLPLASTTRIAVIDVVGVSNVLVMGGAPSVTVLPERTRSLPDELRDRLGAAAEVVHHVIGHGEHPLAPLAAADAAGPITATIRDSDSSVVHHRDLDAFDLSEPSTGPAWTATVRASYRASQTGRHTITAEFAGQLSLRVDGAELVSGFREASPMVSGPRYPLHCVVDLTAGQVVTVEAVYDTGVAITIPGMGTRPHLSVGIAAPDPDVDRAAAAAATSDVAIVIAGRLSGEAMDVESCQLPLNQRAAVAAMAAANPSTVLITLGAGPVVVPDPEAFAAWTHVWFPGEQFGPALADVLVGRLEPGGRLPITFPADEDHVPTPQRSERYPGGSWPVSRTDRAAYTEELLVGYRWYDAHEVPVAFPFGHGLGYTTTVLHDFQLDLTDGAFEAVVRVSNTGPRPGKAVPQIYVSYPPDATEPRAQLKGFGTAWLEAGETLPVRITIPFDDLDVYDPRLGRRRLPAGGLVFRAALSSADEGLVRRAHLA